MKSIAGFALAARGKNPHGIPMKQCQSAPRVSAPRGGRSLPCEIRAAMHPRWAATLTWPQCKPCFTECNVRHTLCSFLASLCVAPRANSSAIHLSSRLAGPTEQVKRESRQEIT